MTINPLSLRMLDNHPQDAARALEKYHPSELAGYLEEMPVTSTAKVMRQLVPAVAADCLGEMPPDAAAAILEEFSVERATALLRHMPVSQRNNLIRNLSPLYTNMVKLVLRYPEGTVGQLMTPRVFAAHEDMRSDDLLQTIQGMTGQLQKLIFIINDDHQLVGKVDIRDLLTGEGVSAISRLMQPAGTVVSARSSIGSVQHIGEWKYTDILPVVDHAGQFIGVLKRGVMLDALAHEAPRNQEDFATTALAIAEIFWEACANILVPEPRNTDKRHNDD